MSQRISVRRSCLSFLDRSGSTVYLRPDSLIEGVGILSISRDGMLKHTLLGYTATKGVENGELVRCTWIVDAKGLLYQRRSGTGRNFELTLYALPISPLHSPSQAPFKTTNQHPHHSSVSCTYLELLGRTHHGRNCSSQM